MSASALRATPISPAANPPLETDDVTAELEALFFVGMVDGVRSGVPEQWFFEAYYKADGITAARIAYIRERVLALCPETPQNLCTGCGKPVAGTYCDPCGAKVQELITEQHFVLGPYTLPMPELMMWHGDWREDLHIMWTLICEKWWVVGFAMMAALALIAGWMLAHGGRTA